jgi:benzoyl-CoA reductase/2-hydroxyglutaryl-CoA dehydratase subunit BcrC/BadD/HgdB
LTYDVESVRVRRHLERTRGLPYLKIVTDYSPSDSQQLKLRVEAFVTMIKERAEKGRT